MAKVPKQVMIQRRKEVWDLRQKFWTYEAIAEKMGISRQAVSQLLKRITDKYYRDHLEDVERIKTEQVAEHEMIAQEAFQAWERSKKASLMIRKRTPFSGGAALDTGEQVNEQRDNDGDPRYLTIIMVAKEAIRKIVGANAPLKIDARFDELSKLSDDELRKRALEALNEGAETFDNGINSAPGEEEEPMEPASRPTETSLF